MLFYQWQTQPGAASLKRRRAACYRCVLNYLLSYITHTLFQISKRESSATNKVGIYQMPGGPLWSHERPYATSSFFLPDSSTPQHTKTNFDEKIHTLPLFKSNNPKWFFSRKCLWLRCIITRLVAVQQLVVRSGFSTAGLEATKATGATVA